MWTPFPQRPALRSHRRGESGVALIEFAVCLPLLATLVFGTIDLGRAYTLYESAHNVAREAAFYGASHPGQLEPGSGACSDPTNALWRGQHEDSSNTVQVAFSPDLTTCNPSPMPANLQPGSPLKVTATESMSLITPILGAIVGNTVHMSATICVDVAGNPSTTSCS